MRSSVFLQRFDGAVTFVMLTYHRILSNTPSEYGRVQDSGTGFVY